MSSDNRYMRIDSHSSVKIQDLKMWKGQGRELTWRTESDGIEHIVFI